MLSNTAPVLLSAGTRFDWAGNQGVIHFGTQQVFLMKFDSGQFQNFTPNVIYQAYDTGALRLISKIEAPVIYQPIQTDEEADELQRLLCYLEPLDREECPNSNATRKRVIASVGEKLGEPENKRFKPMTLYRRYQRWISSGRNILIFTNNYRKRPESKFSDQLLNLIEEVIYDEYLILNGQNINACFEILRNRCLQEEIPDRCISRSRFYELINELDPIEVTLARLGREAARKKTQYTEEKIWAEFPLQYIEIDAVHLSLGILSEEDDSFLGSLIVYVAIDRFTRCVTGYSTSIKGKNKGERASAVIDCLRHAVKPKTDELETENEWNCFGVPHFVISDAGSAFNNADVLAYITQLGASRITTKTRTPKKKPFIERFFRTLREQLAKKLPGYIPRKIEGIETDLTVEQGACMYLSEVHNTIDTFIVDFYHQSGHKGLNMQTPTEVWKKNCTDNFLCRLPEHIDEMDKFIGTTFHPVIQGPNGVQKNNIMYNSKELHRLFFRLTGNATNPQNPKIRASYSKQDISSISVTDPNTMLSFLVPCTDKRIKKGTSLVEYKEMNKNANPASKKYCSSKDLSVEAAKNRQKKKDKKSKSNNHVGGISSKEPLPEMEALSAQQLEDLIRWESGRLAEVSNNQNSSSGKPPTTDAPDEIVIDFDDLDSHEVE